MRLIKILYLSFAGLLTNLAFAQQSDQKVFFCYDDFPPEKVTGYRYVIIEPVHFSSKDVATLKKNNENVLGYISLGEVNEYAAHYNEVKDLTLGKNEIWNSHILDLSNQKTIQVLMDQITRIIKTKGLDGLFLDNIDNFTTFGPTPQHKHHLLEFFCLLRDYYPNIYLLQNAGISIIDDTASYIDAIAVESVATDYNFETSEYKLRNQEDFRSMLEELKRVRNKYDIPVILVEYAKSPPLKQKVQERISTTGWPHFIGQIELQCRL